MEAREVGDSLFTSSVFAVCAGARFARFITRIVANKGFRCAPPQALRYRRAPRANTSGGLTR